MAKRKAKKDGYISFRVEKALKSRVEAIAEEEERSLSWIMNKMLRDFVENHPSDKSWS